MIDVGGRNPLITIAGGVSALVGVVVTAFALVSVLGGATGAPGSLNAVRQMVEETRMAEAAAREQVAQELARQARLQRKPVALPAEL